MTQDIVWYRGPYWLLVVVIFLAVLGAGIAPAHAQNAGSQSIDSLIQGWRQFGQNEAAKARADASKLTPAQKSGATQLFSSAFELTSQNSYDAAIIAYEHGLSVNPADGRAHYFLGELLAQQNNANQALRHFATAMALVPTGIEGVKAEAALKRTIAETVTANAWAQQQQAQQQEAQRLQAEAVAREVVHAGDVLNIRSEYWTGQVYHNDQGELRITSRTDGNNFSGEFIYRIVSSRDNIVQTIHQNAHILVDGNSMRISCSDPFWVSGSGIYYVDNFSLGLVNGAWSGVNNDASGGSFPVTMFITR